jgi:hypothetical protein
VEASDATNMTPLQNAFSEHCKKLLDFLHAKHNGLDRMFAERTYCISFYTDYVVFEKRLMNRSSTVPLMIPVPRQSFKEKTIVILKKIGLFNAARKIYGTLKKIRGRN